jgi:UDP-glucose 4-epimerase
MARSVLITGAGGFLAGHFADAFAAAGWRTIGVGRTDPNRQAERFDGFDLHDVADTEHNVSLLERYTPDAVVHLAAPASVQQSMRNPLADVHGHVLPTAGLLESIRIAGIDTRVILVSSAAVYGDPATLPVREDAPLAPISPYGFHKLQQETLLDEYVRIHGLRGCKARIFSTYGEHLRRLAVWDIARRALAGHRAVFGSGDETRDYLYAGDAGRAICVLAEQAACGGEAVNVASGEAVTIRSLAEEIFRAVGAEDAPDFTGETLAGSPLRWRADVTRLQSLGFTAPRWSSGLPRTIRWIREQL